MLRNPSAKDKSQDVHIPASLPVLTLPVNQVLLPGAALSIQIFRKDNLDLLQAVFAEADRSQSVPLIAVAPLKPRGSAAGGVAAIRQEPSPKDVSNKLQFIKLPSDSDNGTIAGARPGPKPSVDEIYEYACAARIVRVEGLSSNYTIKGQRTSQKGYIVILEGICRVHLDRFTHIGYPYFQAEVTAHPREEPDKAIPEELLSSMHESATKLLDLLSSTFGDSDSKNEATTRSQMSKAGRSMSQLAIKQLRQVLRNFSRETADEISDILMSTLFPSTRALSFAAKLTHLSLTNPKDRIQNATNALSVTMTELQYSENISNRYNENIQRRTKEMILRGLLEAIHQELRALKNTENGEGGQDPDGPPVVRIIRQGNGGPRGVGAAPPSPEEEEEEDDITVLDRKIKESSMPPDALTIATRELKRLRTIPPQSIEHSGIRNYLDWLLDLPWGKASYDTEENKIIDQNFLDQARKQLDDDHFGIEQVKSRLLQYLAVLRLRNEAFEIAESIRKQKEAEEERIAEQQKTQAAEQQAKEAATTRHEPTTGTTSTALIKAPKDAEKNQVLPKTPSPTSLNKRKGKRGPVMKDKSPILLLVGPPGVGKTSIARSLASALGRPYERISLSGVRDEAMLRGFRRTYVGSMPGVIVQALRKAKVNNPIILLDEIDKLASGNSHHGDPSAAMVSERSAYVESLHRLAERCTKQLEILDPEQNFSFNDHYINTPIDLSSVLFIATANDMSTISPPLLDRMEIIHLSGYVDTEKLQIARKYLLPKQVSANQLQPDHICIEDATLLQVINKYCGGESGVRTLERQIGSICRWKAVEFARARDAIPTETRPALNSKTVEGYNPKVTADQLEEILGNDYYDQEDVTSKEEVRPGMATGLAYMGSGSGGILQIEATSMPGKGQLRLTGSLGDVIAESGQLALSWVKANAFNLGLVREREQDIMHGIDVHIHLPSGSVKKDGPSAGLAMTMALVSLFSGQIIDPTVAMTGEITLTGRVTAVGGIKEKILGAHRAGVQKLILPYRNKRHVQNDLLVSTERTTTVSYVHSIWEAYSLVFPQRPRVIGGIQEHFSDKSVQSRL